VKVKVAEAWSVGVVLLLVFFLVKQTLSTCPDLLQYMQCNFTLLPVPDPEMRMEGRRKLKIDRKEAHGANNP